VFPIERAHGTALVIATSLGCGAGKCPFTIAHATTDTATADARIRPTITRLPSSTPDSIRVMVSAAPGPDRNPSKA
jgi:hypothetical protein